MACATASLSLTLPIRAHHAKFAQAPSLSTPNKLSKLMVSKKSSLVVTASSAQEGKKQKKKKKEEEVFSVAGLTALALTAATVIPEMAEAAGPGVSPSLKNFLLSLVAGGVVIAAISIAVIGVSNFDPVKRT